VEIPKQVHPQTHSGVPQNTTGAWGSFVGSKRTTSDEEGDFSVVISRKRQRMLTSEQNFPNQTAAGNGVTGVVKTQITGTAKRSLRMVGTDYTTSLLLKAAKDQTRKEVFYISNAGIDTDSTNITNFFNSQKVRVLSCFEAKTRF